VSANQGQRALALAGVLGIAAAIVGYYGLSGVAAKAAARASGDFRDVVVTTSDLTFGQKLEPTMLHVVHYPKDAVPVGAYSTVDSVVGQTTKVFMGAREPVTATKLSSRGGGLSMLIRPNMRAASIEVHNVSGVSGFVLPGDRVDVLVTVDRTPNNVPITNTLLQSVEVLAAGQKTQQKDGTPLSVQSVTLLVDPEGAQKLALAAREGEIHLVLRNPDDNAEVKVNRYTTGELIGMAPPAPYHGPGRAPAPVATMPQPRNLDPGKVRIIRSAQVTESPAIPDSTTH